MKNNKKTDPRKEKAAGKKQKKGEEVDPEKLEEPITERVSKKIPKRKPLGPSGAEWDL